MLITKKNKKDYNQMPGFEILSVILVASAAPIIKRERNKKSSSIEDEIDD